MKFSSSLPKIPSKLSTNLAQASFLYFDVPTHFVAKTVWKESLSYSGPKLKSEGYKSAASKFDENNPDAFFNELVFFQRTKWPFPLSQLSLSRKD